MSIVNWNVAIMKHFESRTMAYSSKRKSNQWTAVSASARMS